jgi:hypothetical protein
MPPSGPDPVAVRIAHPYDDWVSNGAVLETEGYCFPDTVADYDVRAEVRYWDWGIPGVAVLEGRALPAVPPFHWKFEFDPVFPADTWVTLVVFCRHPVHDDIGQDCATVYVKSRIMEKCKALARRRKKGKKKPRK